MARKTAKMSLEVDGPFAQAKKAASDFGFNMMYTQALDESLRLIDIAQREYDEAVEDGDEIICLLYTSPSPRDLSTSRMPSSA